MEDRQQRKPPASSAAWTPTRICMSPPWSTSKTACWAPIASQPHGRATDRCCTGCARSASSSASVSNRPVPTARDCCATCRAAGIDVLEVTAPDKQDRRRRGKDDDLDAQNAAHAAFAGKRSRHAEDSRRDDRVAAGAKSMPQDGRRRAQGRLADDSEHYRLCARRAARRASQSDPHAAHPDAGGLAARPVRLPQCRLGVPNHVSSRSVVDTWSCTTRSPTWT